MKENHFEKPEDGAVTDTQLLEALVMNLSDQQIEALYQVMKPGTPLGDAFHARVDEWRGSAEITDPELMRQRIMREIRSNSRFNKSFFAELDKLMQKKDMSDSALYNAIGISQPLWVNIRKKGIQDYGKRVRDAHTKRENVLKMAIVLEADYFELYNLMCYGGFSFSPSTNIGDCVIASCVQAKVYDPFQIDEYLSAAGARTLFSEE